MLSQTSPGHTVLCTVYIGMCVCGGSYFIAFHSVCMHVCMWISIGGAECLYVPFN